MAEEKKPFQSPGVAWVSGFALALVLVIGGLGGYAYWRLEKRLAQTQERLHTGESSRSQLQPQLARLKDELARLQSAVEGIEGVKERQKDLVGRVKNLAKRTTELASRTESHNQRLKALQKSTEQLVARVQGGPDYWRLEWVENLLLAAHRGGRLGGDTEAAYWALKKADKVLGELEDPAWLDVRQAIQKAMTRLEQVPKPDPLGIMVRLSSLEEAALDLPLKSRSLPASEESPGSESPADKVATDSADTDSSDPQTIWGKIRGAASSFGEELEGLVRLRRSEEKVEPLLPPEEAAFLRHNLVLALESARVAALRGHVSAYKDSLDRARDWVRRFFEPQNDEVAAMLKALEEVRARPLRVKVPDLSEPLETFQRLRQERKRGE